MAMIFGAFLPKFVELLMQMAQDEAVMLLGIPSQTGKLMQTVGDIQRILADAERKKNDNSIIKQWLMELKDVMYDADDVIDLCQIKAKERQSGSSSHPSSNACCASGLLSCLRNPFFAHKIGSQINEINSRLQGIAKRRAELGLIESQIIFHDPSYQVPRVDSIINRRTDPLIVMEDVVGEKIEEDARLLVSWLTDEESDVRGNIGVVVIVGMGGIGKTTLAKRIFNDSKIGEEFKLKIWTCVSKEVKAIELIKCIIRDAGGKHGDAKERSELVPLLGSIIKGKKFFLVLDDVWPESLTVWTELLRAPMSGGAKGSRLLVTTRDNRVANALKATKSHFVEKMSEEDGWSLLVKQVFENEGENEIQEFEKIGLELVKKCDGLPLAIKSIGGVLCGRSKTIGEWQAVLKSNAWSMNELPSGIHQAFYLSYEDLPPHLKQCFIFCSLFPEDRVFDTTDLIYLWCAEGFLQDNDNLWELGNEYNRELLSRNLLEKVYSIHDITFSKMHDLLWSFARYLGKDENFILREGEAFYRETNLPKLRRLSIEQKKVNYQQFEKEKWLRTLLIRDVSLNKLGDIYSTLRKLRILDLSYSEVAALPDSVGALIHLRYLCVRGELRTIPDSIGYLGNLIYLDVSRCSELQHVPSSIINLKQLRYLNLSSTKVMGIPVGLKNLERLIELGGFRPSKSGSKEFSSLDELETLTNLICLMLRGLENVTDKSIAKRATLHCKYKLKLLGFKYTALSWAEQVSQTNEKKATTEDILNELCPPSSIEIISIDGYFGSCLPNWLNLGTTLPNLRILHIAMCNCFEKLPALGQLPNLNELRVREGYSVHSVGEEFLWGNIKSENNTSPTFPKLNKLFMYNMTNWKEWQWNKGELAMPKLKELFISYCPQLRALPEGLSHHATSLETLNIRGANNLTTVILPTVSDITIEKCPNLKIVETLNALQRMELEDYEMNALPEYLMAITPQRLRINCNMMLLRKITSERESGSEYAKFNHIPKVTFYSWGKSLHATYQKTPFSFTTNISMTA